MATKPSPLLARSAHQRVDEEKAMPEETGTKNPYGYDPETNTVRVGQHDLARLLLMFRTLIREQRPGRWQIGRTNVQITVPSWG
ncbi:hypothetical protein ACPCUF_36510 [Streptomyces griseoincarnatus]